MPRLIGEHLWAAYQLEFELHRTIDAANVGPGARLTITLPAAKA